MKTSFSHLAVAGTLLVSICANAAFAADATNERCLNFKTRTWSSCVVVEHGIERRNTSTDNNSSVSASASSSPSPIPNEEEIIVTPQLQNIPGQASVNLSKKKAPKNVFSARDFDAQDRDSDGARGKAAGGRESGSKGGESKGGTPQ